MYGGGGGERENMLIFYNFPLNDEVNLDGEKTSVGLFTRGTKG